MLARLKSATTWYADNVMPVAYVWNAGADAFNRSGIVEWYNDTSEQVWDWYSDTRIGQTAAGQRYREVGQMKLSGLARWNTGTIISSVIPHTSALLSGEGALGNPLEWGIGSGKSLLNIGSGTLNTAIVRPLSDIVYVASEHRMGGIPTLEITPEQLPGAAGTEIAAVFLTRRPAAGLTRAGAGARVATSSAEGTWQLGRGADGLYGACFLPGTMVHTQDGVKPIERIQAGDWVAARNQFNKKTQWRPVLQTFETPDKEAVHVEIEHADGVRETISCTTEHPFYVVDKGWCGANRLQSGDSLELLDGGRSKVITVVADSGRHAVYNFEVADDHTYFVGDRGVWVHNASRVNYVPSSASKRFRLSSMGDGQGLVGKNWEFNPLKDIDMRGTNSAWTDGVDAAFERIEYLSGYTRDQFVPVKRAFASDGKSMAVEWVGPRGAQVNMDIPELQLGPKGFPDGPSVPHIGWRAGGKVLNGKGHIFVDGPIPATRTRLGIEDLEF